MNEYVLTPMRREIEVEKLATVHYYEYDDDFFFPGEVHNFWELLYVDKGSVKVTGGSAQYLLKKGDIIFHKPMEFHNLKATPANAPNLVIVAFECTSPAMRFFEGKVLRVGDFARNLLAKIVEEAHGAFSCALDDPDLRQLVFKERVPFGAEQIIQIILELLLVSLIREADVDPGKAKISSSIKEKTDEDVFSRVVLYLEQNLRNRITLDDVCRSNLLGRSYLQKVFREKSGGGVMEYFGKMKLDAAKREIRDGARNFTEIANDLGYTSIHYFSRHFKKVNGMTPTEYASSVKSRSENQKDRPIFFYD